MSEEPVGGSTQSTKVIATITGLLCAPPAGAFLATCFLVIYQEMTTDAPVIVGPTSATLTFALPLMYGAIFGWPVAFVIGWPVHIFLQLHRANRLLQYALFGATIACTLIPLTLISGALTGLFYMFAFGIALAGGIGGLIFWLIRRPDRDGGLGSQAASPEDVGS